MKVVFTLVAANNKNDTSIMHAAKSFKKVSFECYPYAAPCPHVQVVVLQTVILQVDIDRYVVILSYHVIQLTFDGDQKSSQGSGQGQIK